MLLPFLRSAVASALRSFVREPLAPLLGIGTVALGFAITGFLAVIAHDLQSVAEHGTPRAEMIVELGDDVDATRAAEISNRIASLPVVASVRRVDGAEAMRRLRESLGGEARVLDGLEPDYLPSSLEVAFRAETAGVTATSALADRLEHTPGVSRVAYVGDWVQRLAKLLQVARWVVLAALALAGLGSLWVIGAMTRMRALARRDEIEILKLVGATDGFVKAPLLIEGALIGSLGAVLGAAALHGITTWLRPLVAAAPDTVFAHRFAFDLAGMLSPSMFAKAIALCALLCALSSSFSARRYTRA